jgi:hypothetical protein
MRKGLVVVLVAMLLAGCAAMPERDRNTIAGATVGAGVGALVGWAVGGPSAGWIGAAVGSAAGGAIGYMIRPEGCFIHNARNELWQVPCDDMPVRAVGCYTGNTEIFGVREIECPRRWQRQLGRTKVATAAY